LNWRLLICSSLALFFLLVSAADTLIVAGHSQLLTRPLIVEKGEVLAPLVPALRLLGATTALKGTILAVTLPNHPTFKVTAGSTSVTCNGRKTPLPVAPRMVEDELYLPVNALAPLLEAEVRFDTGSRTLTVSPLLTVSYELRPEGLAVIVSSLAPVQFTSTGTDDPPRLLFDFRGFATKTEQQMPVNAGRVEQLRLSQTDQPLSTVHLAIDCLEPSSPAPTVYEQGRLVTIIIGKKTAQPTTAPTSPVLAPVSLIALKLHAHSEKQSELNLAASGQTQLDCDYNRDARQLTLTVKNGLNALPAVQLVGLHDNVVDHVEASGDEKTTGAKIVVTFKQDAGYLVQQDQQGVRVLMGTFSIKDMIITLDAGHGGYDTGAVGQNGTCEKDVNLDVILRTGKLLEHEGATVLYTRNDNTFIPLNDRPALANKHNADIFVSVHCNSMPHPNTASGTQTYYFTGQSARLAAAMHAELVKGLGLHDGGIHTARYLVIHKTTMPAVLLELAFINNTREEALLCTPEFRQQAAEAILNGVRHYAATRDWEFRKTELPPSLNNPAMATAPVTAH